ncbi:MAG TPA: alpha/beta fold hydrolase [Leucothrix mucor]|nr:alpha/beta fold hydrolase [Leucothrix mucor]
MFKIAIKSVILQLSILLLIILISPVFAAAWLNHEIFSPPRRVLQNYHLDQLQSPKNYGLTIRHYGCLQNKVPCLLVEPNAKTGAGRRGNILRKQIMAKGINLPDYGKIRGIIVLLHGRNGRKEDLLPVAERFVAAGFRCLIPDLPAHGDSPLASMSFGSNHFEASLPRRILEDARKKFSLPDEPAALWGMSMGGAVAISAVNEAPDYWNALLVISSFAKLNHILDRQIPNRIKPLKDIIHFYLNLAQWLGGQPSINDVQPQEWAKQVNIPTLIVHGEKDYFIPPSQGKLLYQAINSPKKRWLIVPKGGHVNVLATTMPLYAEMNSWLIKVL